MLILYFENSTFGVIVTGPVGSRLVRSGRVTYSQKMDPWSTSLI